MESRLRILFLRGLLLAAVLMAGAGCSRVTGTTADPRAAEPVIEPEVERREIRRARIDTENFELSAFGGFKSVEDFGSNAVYGLRLAYHITEGLFAEASYGQTDVGQTSFETLSGAAELISDRQYSYYDLSLGYNLLPGEVFIGRNRAFNSALYVLVGAGSTDFAGESLFTVSFGAGYRVLLTDWLSAHFMVRDHIFRTDLTGKDKTAHNIEFVLGLGWFF